MCNCAARVVGFCFLFVFTIVDAYSACFVATTCKSRAISGTVLQMGSRNRAWAKGELSDKDIFDDAPPSSKGKVKPKAEEVIYDGPPSRAELIVPTLSIITVIGIIPFLAALTRQFWVKYKITSQRINIKSGVAGKDVSEIVYSNIKEMRFAFRAFGLAGDLVLFLKDGAQAEMRFVPDFARLYQFIFDQCDESCRSKSMKIVAKDEQ